MIRIKSDYRPDIITTEKVGFFYADHFIQYLGQQDSPPRSYPLLCMAADWVANEPMWTEGTPEQVILYNTEQLTRSDTGLISRIVNRCRQQDIVEVWDFSEVNIGVFAKWGIHAKHYPLKIIGPVLERLRTIVPQQLTYDVGFCGALSTRRRVILEELEKKGYTVYISKTSGLCRDTELAQCRVILNIHYAPDYRVHESHRCEPWLALGDPYLVVSETSIDSDSRCYNAEYSDLVSTIQRLLTKP
jgi:hypothetical protein